MQELRKEQLTYRSVWRSWRNIAITPTTGVAGEIASLQQSSLLDELMVTGRGGLLDEKLYRHRQPARGETGAIEPTPAGTK